MPNDRRVLIVGPQANELRRRVGLTSWAVLEEMVQASTGSADALVAEVSIRSLAASLGLAKDTVAAAVRRLRNHRVVEATQPRSARGAFRTGRYRINVPAVYLAVAPTGPRSLPASSHRAALRSCDSGQLALTLEA